MKFNEVEFNLSESFIDKYKRKQVNWGPLGFFIYKRTYARILPNGKTEEWLQTIQRVVEGCYVIQKNHCKNLSIPWNERQAQKSSQIMYDCIFNFKFLPPGRGLWAMGTEFLFKKGNACLQNCGFTSTEELTQDFSGPFVWLMDMSMFGVGVGFDTKGAEEELFLKKPKTTEDIHIVEDSREGWVDTFRRILDSYVKKDTMPYKFDLSSIRVAGTPIKGFGGICPGPEPLQRLINKTINLLDSYVTADKPVDSTLIVDLMNVAGEAVVSGGVRRSAEIALGDIKDQEFLNLKNSDKLIDERYARWASNNSIICKVGEDYSSIIPGMVENGEPGIFWVNNAREYGRMGDPKNRKDEQIRGVNPCGEQPLWNKELCCLVESFPSKHESLEDFKNTLKYAYLYAKTVTLLPTHCERTNAIMFRNRRIGLSQTGVIENINKIGINQHLYWCDEGYKTIKEWDKRYSDWFCIPRSIKLTTVKPSGSVSLLPGVTPGIHFPHSEYYIRRVRVSKSSNLWEIMKEAGYKVEPDEYEKLNTMVIEFPVHEPYFSLRKDEVSIWEQLELAAQMQAKWSDNAVSITVTIPSGQEKDLNRALSLYDSRLKSVSFLPLKSDNSYIQAPYESITKEQYEEAVSKLKKYKLNLNEEDKIQEKFCNNDVCVLN